MGDLIVSVDIGTSKACTLVGKVGRTGQLEILGKGMVPCTGLKKGMIVDIDSTAEAIRAAVNMAETSANVKIASAYANIIGMHVNVVDNRSSLPIANGNREITAKDADNVLYSVQNIDIPEDREIIDIIPRQFIIDGYDEITDPVGMVGTKLEVDADILIGKITSVQNIVKSMERAGIKIDGLVAEAFAEGELALTPDEKDTGVIMLDVGGEVTDISVYKGKRLLFYESIPIGGDHITSDIAIGLRISSSEAEKIKRQYELALTTLIKNDQEITVFDVKENIKKNVRISEVVEIIEARVYEIFSLCREAAEKAGVLNGLNSGVVLTGGGISYVDGNRQLAGEVFDLPVRVASINYPGISKPEYMVSAGMIKYIANISKNGSAGSEVRLQKPVIPSRPARKGILEKILSFLKEIF